MFFNEDYKLASDGEGFIIRKMSRFEMQFAVEIAANEGWNPGLYEAGCFYDTDPDGFFIGTFNRTPVGCIYAVAYGSGFGFIGNYIVEPGFRGRGYGIQLWNKALDYLKGVNCIGLDGAIAQQKNYSKSGFKSAYRTIRFEGKPTGMKSNSRKILGISKIPFKSILRYDNKLFPVERNSFLKRWIRQPDSFACGFVENEKLKGYGVIRKCKHGNKIDPLFADNTGVAKEILIKLTSSIKEEELYYLDIPEVNQDGLSLSGEFKMKRISKTVRMYLGTAPELPVRKIFGTTSLALG